MNFLTDLTTDIIAEGTVGAILGCYVGIVTRGSPKMHALAFATEAAVGGLCKTFLTELGKRYAQTPQQSRACLFTAVIMSGVMRTVTLVAMYYLSFINTIALSASVATICVRVISAIVSFPMQI
jgi:hypothetical protein